MKKEEKMPRFAQAMVRYQSDSEADMEKMEEASRGAI